MTSTNGNRSFLPVPEFLEANNLSYTLKQPQNLNSYKSKRPPKLCPKNYDTSFNRSLNSSTAHAISFRESSGLENQLLSPIYDKDNSDSYFEQCFDIITKIGEGSFGEVFKVRSKEDGILYAVKKSKQYFRSENYRQERLEEVRRYEEFSNHKHCIKLHRAWEQDDRLYMQMELCESSLNCFVANKTLSESTVWSILLDLLFALKSLHDRNLIHLDIKLDNILIMEDESCKLGDFGLVADVNRANIYEAMEGDPRYMAPELMQGNFSKAADIFSLGIAILELSCNLELPPNGPLWQELRNGIFPEDIIKVISPELQEIVKKMMQPNPLDRPTVDEILSNSILLDIQQNRGRWMLYRKVKKSIRKTGRFLWRKLCNLKNYISRIFSSWLMIFRLQNSRTISTSDESSSDKIMDYASSSTSQNSPNLSDYETNDKIVNSTPISHLNDEFSKFRKGRPRIFAGAEPFKSDESFSPTNGNYDLIKHSSPALNHESSTFICKKLFYKSDDSD